MCNSISHDVTWVRHDTIRSHLVLLHFKMPIFIYLAGSLKLQFLMFWDIVWEGHHEVFINKKSAIFIVYCIPCYDPYFLTACYIISWNNYYNNNTGSSIYYVIHVQYFVNIFEDNVVDRNGETQ